MSIRSNSSSLLPDAECRPHCGTGSNGHPGQSHMNIQYSIAILAILYCTVRDNISIDTDTCRSRGGTPSAELIRSRRRPVASSPLTWWRNPFCQSFFSNALCRWVPLNHSTYQRMPIDTDCCPVSWCMSGQYSEDIASEKRVALPLNAQVKECPPCRRLALLKHRHNKKERGSISGGEWGKVCFVPPQSDLSSCTGIAPMCISRGMMEKVSNFLRRPLPLIHFDRR
jgi:hypothetical protein